MEVERLIEGIKIGNAVSSVGNSKGLVELKTTVEYLLNYTLPNEEVAEELKKMDNTLTTHIANGLLMSDVDVNTLYDRLFVLTKESKAEFLKSRPALIVGADPEDTFNLLTKVYELGNGKLLVANSLIGKRVSELYAELNYITALVSCYNKIIAEHKIVVELSNAAGSTNLYRFHYDNYKHNILGKISDDNRYLRLNDKYALDILNMSPNTVRDILDVSSVISVLDTLYIDMVDELMDGDYVHYLINMLLPTKRELHNTVNKVAVIGSEIVDSIEKLKKHLPDDNIDIPEE